jgi:hypothetical protein
MSQLQMDHEHHHHQEPFEDQHSGWNGDGGFHGMPHHHSPVQDYNGFNSFAPLPMEPLYGTNMHPPHQTHPTPRTTHPQLQPLIMPQMSQWPSMLTSQSTYQASLFPSAAPPPITPASATPVSASSTHSRTSSTPRKTLTDSDRRRMCQYHEDNPTVKQTEIGGTLALDTLVNMDIQLTLPQQCSVWKEGTTAYAICLLPC